MDEHKLSQRQKQIEYGKVTHGYQNYLLHVPKHKRQHKRLGHRDTPDPYSRECSTRSFAGQVRSWRRYLHKWDNPRWIDLLELGDE